MTPIALRRWTAYLVFAKYLYLTLFGCALSKRPIPQMVCSTRGSSAMSPDAKNTIGWRYSVTSACHCAAP